MPRTPSRSRTSADIATILGLFAAIVSGFFIPAAVGANLPLLVRVVQPLLGALILGIFIYVVTRRREERRRVKYALDALRDYTLNLELGALEKSRIRNVSLRVATLLRWVDLVANQLPPEERQDALFRAGYASGRSWGSDLKNKVLPAYEEAKSLKEWLQVWADYDASAGWGRFEIHLDRNNRGGVTLINSFSAEESTLSPTNYLIAGYLAGVLEELLDEKMTVRPATPKPDVAREEGDITFYVERARTELGTEADSRSRRGLWQRAARPPS